MSEKFVEMERGGWREDNKTVDVKVTRKGYANKMSGGKMQREKNRKEWKGPP